MFFVVSDILLPDLKLLNEQWFVEGESKSKLILLAGFCYTLIIESCWEGVLSL